MREIEFRGKSVETGEWVKGWFCGGDCDGFFAPTKDSAQIIDKDLFWNEVYPETVGQYIGLKDRRGQKVFEGDIIDLFGNTFYVGFKEGEYILKSPESDDFLSILLLQTEKFYVEGNVYDNPELIVNR